MAIPSLPTVVFSAIVTNIESQLDAYDDDDGDHITIDDDEYNEFIGIAGECKIPENKKAEALANMVSVAGVLAYREKKKFYKIRDYGLMCNYSLASAHLLCLMLNFQTRESDITKYSKLQDIGYQFAAAFSLLQKDPIPA
uniref:Uncharacterized protein n=1 Tax=Amphimedon queenslandica TaxID=400682 RepID=A0A1X7V833_AMPQE